MREYEPEFVMQDGMVIPKSFTSRHHTLWRRDSYKSVAEKRTREMPGMVLRLAINHHQDLHRHVPPPEKPNPQLLSGLYNHNMHNLESLNVYDRFEAITELLGKIASTSGKNALSAGMLHENFEEQLPYIQAGRVDIHNG